MIYRQCSFIFRVLFSIFKIGCLAPSAFPFDLVQIICSFFGVRGCRATNGQLSVSVEAALRCTPRSKSESFLQSIASSFGLFDCLLVIFSDLDEGRRQQDLRL